ncbi:MAG TPA: hypothetical protein VFJ02_11175 [Vicinamibacterales bacterium]|nr:hypothetical protein [Vicinamibacterales bacterium]
MRRVILTALLCTCISALIHAQTPDPQLMAPITKFIDTFNKGDMAGAASTHAAEPDLAITDEVAPYFWRGAKAFESWAGDLDRDAKKNGITEQKVVLGSATRVETDGNAAYVIVPSTYTFKLKGVAMREAAQMTFTLKKGASGWLIHGWTWTGPRAKKVG